MPHSGMGVAGSSWLALSSAGRLLVVEPVNQRDALVEIFLSLRAIGFNRVVATTNGREAQVLGFRSGGSVLRTNEFAKRKKQQGDPNEHCHECLRRRLQLNLPTEKCRGKFFQEWPPGKLDANCAIKAQRFLDHTISGKNAFDSAAARLAHLRRQVIVTQDFAQRFGQCRRISWLDLQAALAVFHNLA